MNALVVLLDGVGALALGGAVAYGLAAWRNGTKSGSMDERVRRFAEAGAGLPVSVPGDADFGASGRSLQDTGKRLLMRLRREVEGSSQAAGVAQRPRAVQVAEKLARADVKLRPAEWYLIRIGVVLVLALLGLALYRSLIFAGILAVVGFFIPPMVLRFRTSRRLGRFNGQLGDTLILLSNALKAGYSFPQAMASIARSAPPPTSEEFARATREVQLGVTTDEALSHMVQRIHSEDLDLVVTAVQIQRVVGGNLAEIFDNIAFTIRERIRIKGEIKTLTAQARASSFIITGLPIALALILEAINPAYIAPLLNFAGPGPFILIGCAISISFAFYVMQRIANIEV
ncbi:MAG TPA: type II secretion system F family protein [Candidatus Dormibacteraeota bacterium]|nr:type II secretion system F family protein [Candidatus Dormibacteraeota bacterium]